MVDAATAIALFFASPTVLSLMIILVINLAIVAVIMGKKKFVPTKIFLLNALLWAGMFIDAGMLPEVYAIVFIVSAAGMVTYFYGELFGKGQSGYQKMFVQYIVFFGLTILLQGWVLLTSNVFTGDVSFTNPGLNFIEWAVQLAKLFSINTTLAIFNVVLVIPFGFFIGIYIINLIRGAQ